MLEFIKMFGLGIMYTLFFPLIVAIFAIYIVYVFFNYLVLEIINIFGFFFGYNFTVETELERQLETMKDNHNIDNERKEAFAGEFFSQETIGEELRGSDEHE